MSAAKDDNDNGNPDLLNQVVQFVQSTKPNYLFIKLLWFVILIGLFAPNLRVALRSRRDVCHDDGLRVAAYDHYQLYHHYEY